MWSDVDGFEYRMKQLRAPSVAILGVHWSFSCEAFILSCCMLEAKEVDDGHADCTTMFQIKFGWDACASSLGCVAEQSLGKLDVG